MKGGGWLAIAGVVLAYDSWVIAKDEPTLSRQFRDTATAHPLLVAATTGYLVAHLYGAWPAKADPFTLLAYSVRALT